MVGGDEEHLDLGGGADLAQPEVAGERAVLGPPGERQRARRAERRGGVGVERGSGFGGEGGVLVDLHQADRVAGGALVGAGAAAERRGARARRR